jgi:hypothetical protein
MADCVAVVCLISDPTLVDHLRPNPDEVDHVFSHPLEAVLRGQPDASSVDTLAKSGGEWWPHEEEFYVSSLAFPGAQRLPFGDPSAE